MPGSAHPQAGRIPRHGAVGPVIDGIRPPKIRFANFRFPDAPSGRSAEARTFSSDREFAPFRTAAKTRLANHTAGVGLQRAAERLPCRRLGLGAPNLRPRDL